MGGSGQESPQQTDVWKAFSPNLDEFSIKLPVEMKLEGKADAKSTRTYRAIYAENYYYVFSDTYKDRTCAKFVDYFAKANGKDTSVEKTTETRYEAQFVDGDAFYHRIVALRSISRVFIAQTVSEKDHDPNALRFLESFSLGRTEDVPIDVPMTPQAVIVTKSGGGISESKQGANQNGIFAQPSPAAVPVGETRPLRILSKPKAIFTDFARFYMAEGFVQLRITFLSTGNIGSVTVTKKMPFGLTSQAIAAAKQVTFEPALANGTPVSVSKTFQYQFTIY